MEFNQNKELLSNTLALNVALQTIKERCVHLQKRLYALESENSQLRLSTIHSNSDNKRHESRKDNSLVSELEDLRAKNAELNLQKNQLTENLSMISLENRKLWKRLSHLTKENVDDDNLVKGSNGNEKGEEQTSTSKHANLIRSKTFTQNSPHQLLREKIAGNHIGPIDGDDLEDISLINDCGFVAASSNVDTEAALEQEACDIDTRTCTEGLLYIKRELLKQNNDLRSALGNWRKFKTLEACSCKVSAKSDNSKSNKKPLMIDKSLETERDLVTLDFLVEQDLPNNNNNDFDPSKKENILIDLIEKKKADLAEKICPMCGKFYTQNILFEEFLEHVESHFSGSSDIDSELSLEHNFELVSHSVGNF